MEAGEKLTLTVKAADRWSALDDVKLVNDAGVDIVQNLVISSIVVEILPMQSPRVTITCSAYKGFDAVLEGVVATLRSEPMPDLNLNELVATESKAG